jgi:hypothetical protein
MLDQQESEQRPECPNGHHASGNIDHHPKRVVSNPRSQANEAREAQAALAAELAGVRQRVEDERAHAEVRLADQRAGYEERLTEIRVESSAFAPGEISQGKSAAQRRLVQMPDPPFSRLATLAGRLGKPPGSLRCLRSGGVTPFAPCSVGALRYLLQAPDVVSEGSG